jgi:alpha-D-xyloside xylohydrolase
MDGVVKGIHDVTGPPEILPKWALGFMVSKEHYQSSRELLDCVAGYVQRKVPMDCVIQDWQYWPAACWEAEFDEKRYANAREWIGKIHAAGKRFMITIWPHFMGGVQCAWRKGMNQSWFYPHAQNDGSWYDALNPAALKGFWQEVRGICEDGIDAFWCDACEPETSLYDQSLADHEASMNPTFLGPAKEFLLPYVGQHMKGLYEGWMAEKFDRRPFFLPRAAFTGMGKYAGCPWSGDIHCTWQQ